MKKINLMPSEYKAAELSKVIRQVSTLIAIIPIIYILYLGVANYKLYAEIKDIKSKIDYVDDLKRSIQSKEDTIKSKNDFITSLERSEFELNKFVTFLNEQVSDDLIVISVDSTDRLIKTNKAVDGVELTTEDHITDITSAGVTDEIIELNADGTPVENVQEVEVTPPADFPKDMKLVLRGYSKNNIAIADLIYKITLIDFIGNVKLSAIEEKLTPEGFSNVFEIIIDVN